MKRDEAEAESRKLEEAYQTPQMGNLAVGLATMGVLGGGLCFGTNHMASGIVTGGLFAAAALAALFAK